jgi:hypothetical protein
VAHDVPFHPDKPIFIAQMTAADVARNLLPRWIV